MVDEASTFALAYSLGGYATDVTHISSSGTPVALLGIANAFLNFSNLVNSTATGEYCPVPPPKLRVIGVRLALA